jgi:hypothetical protein
MRTILPSFAGGEWSPAMQSRVDIDKYSIACKTLKNFLVNPTGSVSNRPGTEYIAKVKDSTKKVRLIPFEYSTEQAYILEFGDKYIRFYMNGGQIVSDGAVYEITSPYAAEDLALIKYVQSADTMYLVHPHYTPRTLVRNGHSDWTLSEFAYVNGPFMTENINDNITVNASGTSGTVNLYASTGNSLFSGLAGSLFRISHDTDSTNFPGSMTSKGTNKKLSGTFSAVGASPTIYCQGSWTLILSAAGWGQIIFQKSTDNGETWSDVATYSANTTVSGSSSSTVLYRLYCVSLGSYTDGDGDTEYYSIDYTLTCTQAIYIPANELTTITWRFLSHGVWTAKFHIQKSTDNGSTWVNIESYSGANDYNVNTTGTVDEACLMRVYVYEYTSGTLNYDFYVDGYTHNGVVKINDVTLDTSGYYVVTGKVIHELYSTYPTKYWAKGSWSEANGYPRCVEFYQDRLGFASTNAEPQTQ